ncbi:MAG: hypothetical protein PF689_11415 [Deltaproteobacteria bacterium]|jgi:hypothetical protein|nr:hypothetical protein [Deltaproteobacteria bacterium]
MLIDYTYKLFFKVEEVPSQEKIKEKWEEFPAESFIKIDFNDFLGKKWKIDIPTGMAAKDLNQLFDWFIELIKIYPGEVIIFDPQLGRNIVLENDWEEVVFSVLQHDKWIIENVGGSSLSSAYDDYEIIPGRTKAILFFGVFLVALYFFTHFLLGIYFS